MMTEIKVHVSRADQSVDPYLYVPFDVQKDVTRIDVTMAYRKDEDCVIDLGILDATATDYPSVAGFRGWSGSARDCFFVATDDATPGYIHGEMPAGTWKIMLGLHKLPENGADVVVTIRCDSAPRRLEPQPERRFPRREGAGWYRGDLHCHTFHSDASGSPELLHQAALQAGLDFLAIADHNTITQRRYFHPQSSPDLVFIRAIEITTATGHANVYGVDEWIDFRMTKPEHVHALSRLVHERGGLLSINHDKPTIQWDYDLPEIDCMEVWQSHWMAWNWVSLGRYQERLASGLKITAIGGSDFHQPAQLMPEGPLVLARPTTVFWLDELSEDAILAAMKAGRGYVTESPTGPHLALIVNDQPMGSTVTGPVIAEADVRGADGDLLAWIDATGTVAVQLIQADAWTGTFNGEAKIFLRAEIVAEKSRERLVTEFLKSQEGRSLPWQLRGTDVHRQQIRRAVSNPVHIRP